LRRFIDYDHGATLVAKIDDSTGRVMARQSAWAGGKSDLVGKTLAFPWAEIPETGRLVLGGETDLGPCNALVSVRESGSPWKRSIMLAALSLRGGPAGLVELASTRDSFFRGSDRAALEAYLPCLTLCVKMWREG
jgi:hypothetical protein